MPLAVMLLHFILIPFRLTYDTPQSARLLKMRASLANRHFLPRCFYTMLLRGSITSRARSTICIRSLKVSAFYLWHFQAFPDAIARFCKTIAAVFLFRCKRTIRRTIKVGDPRRAADISISYSANNRQIVFPSRYDRALGKIITLKTMLLIGASMSAKRDIVHVSSPSHVEIMKHTHVRDT